MVMKSIKKMLLGIALILLASYCMPVGIAGNGTYWVLLSLCSFPVAITGIAFVIAGYCGKDDSGEAE